MNSKPLLSSDGRYSYINTYQYDTTPILIKIHGYCYFKLCHK